MSFLAFSSDTIISVSTVVIFFWVFFYLLGTFLITSTSLLIYRTQSTNRLKYRRKFIYSDYKNWYRLTTNQNLAPKVKSGICPCEKNVFWSKLIVNEREIEFSAQTPVERETPVRWIGWCRGGGGGSLIDHRTELTAEWQLSDRRATGRLKLWQLPRSQVVFGWKERMSRWKLVINTNSPVCSAS